MDRYWLLTWRTYGTWLPGAPGFVSEFRDANGDKCLMNAPGEPTADEQPNLAAYAAVIRGDDAVLLDRPQAEAVADQLRETARHRRWQLLALAVMSNHVHLVVGVPGDPDPERLLADFKAWATRRLNHGWEHREHWWVQSGSRRKKDGPEKVREAVEYVRDQPNALAVWLEPRVAARLMELANGRTRIS
jgi:REP element-mobilizing transposase RayT